MVLQLPQCAHADLRRCSACSFSFVDEPVWLAGSFSSNLNRMDVGSVDRSLLVADFVHGLVGRISPRRSWSMVDIGGGDGLLTRVLRDRGIDCRWVDPYCTPNYYVGPRVCSEDHFDLAIMSEVALHLTDPVGTFDSLLRQSDRVLFTAVVPPESITDDWWYLMPSTGQHVAFYPREAIAAMAERLGVHWCSDGKFFHLLSKKKIDRATRFRIEHREVPLIYAHLLGVAGLVDRARGTSRSLIARDEVGVRSSIPDLTEAQDD
jgi:hypothetical protein